MRPDRLSVLTALETQGVAPVFYHPDPEVCLEVIRACARGGAPVVEFTNRGDFACDLFGEISRELVRTDPEVVLGIGSVVDAGTASLYINRAARFVVSPCLVPEVARVCNRRMVAYFPGCGSVTDIGRGARAGLRHRQTVPRIVRGRSGLRQGGPGAHALDQDHADRGGRSRRGLHRQMVRLRHRGGGHGLETDHRRRGQGEGLGCDRSPGARDRGRHRGLPRERPASAADGDLEQPERRTAQIQLGRRDQHQIRVPGPQGVDEQFRVARPPRHRACRVPMAVVAAVCRASGVVALICCAIRLGLGQRQASRRRCRPGSRPDRPSSRCRARSRRSGRSRGR